jgi:hypothetical protein
MKFVERDTTPGKEGTCFRHGKQKLWYIVCTHCVGGTPPGGPIILANEPNPIGVCICADCIQAENYADNRAMCRQCFARLYQQKTGMPLHSIEQLAKNILPGRSPN